MFRTMPPMLSPGADLSGEAGSDTVGRDLNITLSKVGDRFFLFFLVLRVFWYFASMLESGNVSATLLDTSVIRMSVSGFFVCDAGDVASFPASCTPAASDSG